MKLLLAVVMLCGVAVADEPMPHLAYGPNDTIKLELGNVKVLPRQVRICAVGEKFTFCSDWVHPNSRSFIVEIKIPINTPDGEYGAFYEDGKRHIDLHHHFTVER